MHDSGRPMTHPVESQVTRPGGALSPERREAALTRFEALLRQDAVGRSALADRLAELTEASAAVLGADRVSVWQVSADGASLQCLERFEPALPRHSSGGVMECSDYPDYFLALDERRTIELSGREEGAGAPGSPRLDGAEAVLDAPVRVRGRLVAALRFEQRAPRDWTAFDRLLAASAADMVARLLQAREIRKLEQAVAEQHHRIDELVDRRTHDVVRSNADLQREVDDLQEREAEARKSQDNLERMFAASPVPMLLIRRRDDRIVFANDNAARTLRQSMTLLLDSAAGALFEHPSDRADLMATLDRQGSVESLEVQLTCGSGEAFWALLSARPVQVEGDMAVMIGFSDMTAQKTVEHQLRFLATRDPLTQAFNRHHFWQLAQTEMARVKRYKRPLSIAMLDADFFKRINDEFGHDVGDRALTSIVEACNEMLRKNDVLARYGGEEFIILLPETPGEGARLVMERLRERIESMVLQVDGGREVRFTISIGVAGHADEEEFESFLKRADDALFQAKRAGRNCVVAG